MIAWPLCLIAWPLCLMYHVYEASLSVFCCKPVIVWISDSWLPNLPGPCVWPVIMGASLLLIHMMIWFPGPYLALVFCLMYHMGPLFCCKPVNCDSDTYDAWLPALCDAWILIAWLPALCVWPVIMGASLLLIHMMILIWLPGPCLEWPLCDVYVWEWDLFFVDTYDCLALFGVIFGLQTRPKTAHHIRFGVMFGVNDVRFGSVRFWTCCGLDWFAIL